MAGGITNGQRMVGCYLTRTFATGALGETVCALADVNPKEENYGESKASMFGWFGLLMARAWWASLFGKREKRD